MKITLELDIIRIMEKQFKKNINKVKIIFSISSNFLEIFEIFPFKMGYHVYL